MKVLSIQVGKPRSVQFRGSDVSTGIFKSPIDGPIRLGFTNLEGDGQADLRVHGGREKALYAYAYDTYAEWKKIRPQDALENGAFGENLCVDTHFEDRIYVGDTYQLGQARVQACQPRFPCQKLAVKFQDLAILKQFNEFGRPGVYYRVIEEGTVAVGDEFRLLERESSLVSIHELFTIEPPSDATELERVREILKIPSLSENWKKKLRGWADSGV